LLQSRHFATRVTHQAASAKERLESAYFIALSRDPAPKEMSAGLQFLEKQRAHHAQKPSADPELSALTDLCNVILNLNEFVYVQ
jgi:hypothetical protein